MSTRILRAETATPAALAPFGFWLGRDAVAPVIRSPFYGDALAMKKPADFVGDDTLEITVATLNRRPLRRETLRNRQPDARGPAGNHRCFGNKTENVAHGYGKWRFTD